MNAMFHICRIKILYSYTVKCLFNFLGYKDENHNVWSKLESKNVVFLLTSISLPTKRVKRMLED